MAVNVDKMQAFVILNKVGMMVKCKCECKKLIDKDVCDKGFIWYTSNCECECNKSCDVGEY